MTRQEALAAGLSRYFTGKPCKHGHLAERRMSDGCVVCSDKHARDWQAANPEKVKAKGRAHREVHGERLNEKNRAWRKANPEKHIAAVLAWRKANPERLKESKAAWRKRCAGAVNETQMRRYAAKLKRTPAWADVNEIRKVYEECSRQRKIGLDVQVDHIVPLLGRTVCGLHVHNNLRIIQAQENRSKSNQLHFS